VIKASRTLLMILGSLQLFVGIGAIPAGMAFILDPSGASMAMPSSWMTDTVFRTFFLPGLVLLVFHGLGSCVAGFLTYRNYRLAGELAIFFGVGLMVWIFVQIRMVPYHWLQPLYFALGVAETALGFLLRGQIQRRSG